MIKELKLMNWKSFRDSTLYIDPLTILIGSNASGKSNVLDALLFLQRVSSGVGIFQAIAGDINLPALRGGIEWVSRKPMKFFGFEILFESIENKCDYRYNLYIQVNSTKAEIVREELVCLKYSEGKNNAVLTSMFCAEADSSQYSDINISFKGSDNEVVTNRNFTILSQMERVDFGSDLTAGTDQILGCLKKIFIFEPIPSHMRSYSALSEILLSDGSNIAGVLAGMEENRKKEVEISLTKYLKNIPERDIVKVWTETVGKFKTDAMLYCEEGWENLPSHEIDARGMSDGTLRYLAIVTALLTREPGSLLIIEEVDNGLHPSRAKILLSMLKTLGKERNIDVLVTTHNPALLDAAGVDMIPFITVVHRDEKSGESKLTLLEDISQLPKLMASGSLGRMSTEGRIESALKKEHDK